MKSSHQNKDYDSTNVQAAFSELVLFIEIFIDSKT